MDCSVPGFPAFLSGQCLHTAPGHGGLHEAGKTDALGSHSLHVCLLAGVTVRGWSSGTQSLGFHNNLCAIPSPEGILQTSPTKPLPPPLSHLLIAFPLKISPQWGITNTTPNCLAEARITLVSLYM